MEFKYLFLASVFLLFASAVFADGSNLRVITNAGGEGFEYEHYHAGGEFVGNDFVTSNSANSGNVFVYRSIVGTEKSNGQRWDIYNWNNNSKSWDVTKEAGEFTAQDIVNWNQQLRFNAYETKYLEIETSFPLSDPLFKYLDNSKYIYEYCTIASYSYIAPGTANEPYDWDCDNFIPTTGSRQDNGGAKFSVNVRMPLGPNYYPNQQFLARNLVENLTGSTQTAYVLTAIAAEPKHDGSAQKKPGYYYDTAAQKFVLAENLTEKDFLNRFNKQIRLGSQESYTYDIWARFSASEPLFLVDTGKYNVYACSAVSNLPIIEGKTLDTASYNWSCTQFYPKNYQRSGSGNEKKSGSNSSSYSRQGSYNYQSKLLSQAAKNYSEKSHSSKSEKKKSLNIILEK